MKKILTLHESLEILNPYIPIIKRCFEKAFDHHLKLLEHSSAIGDVPSSHSPASRAMIIHDTFKSLISHEFFDDPDIKIINGGSNDIFFIKFHNRIAMKFNKLGDNYRASPSKSRRGDWYQLQGKIDGLDDDIVPIYAGYVPEKTWSSCKGVYLSYWSSQYVNEWYYPLGDYATEYLRIPDIDVVDETYKPQIGKRVKGKKNTETRKNIIQKSSSKNDKKTQRPDRLANYD